MKLMLDINVALDVIEKRSPHVYYSSIVISEALYNHVQGVLPEHRLTTIYYLLAKAKDTRVANQKIDWLLAHFDFKHSPIPAITPEEFVKTYVMLPNNN